MANESQSSAAFPADNPRPLPPGLLAKYPWLTFLLPMLVFMLVGSFEPKPSRPVVEPEVAGAETDEEPPPHDPGLIDTATRALGIEYRHYPLVYTVKIALTAAAMLLVLPGYRTFPFAVHGISVLVGLVGGGVWIGLCKLHLEKTLLEPLGLGAILDLGQRSGFNPLVEMADNPAWAYGFLAIRLVGLVLIVPVFEEFFLRGFVMRFVADPQWWKLPFGQVTTAALVAGTAVPMLMHLGELFAALVWFSGVTWLMLRTRSIWDCIVAHAVTNLTIGMYVVYSAEIAPPGDWWLM